ncbi:putative alanine aminotransferase [Venturia inaequalis]|nr:putative alanine aminotransferase [Venturia inaequalis]
MPDQLWRPQVNATWQIVLSNPLNLPPTTPTPTPNVAIFDIDLFENPKETIDTLHRLGKKAIAYFSAGSFEPDRPDSKEFRAEDLGRKMDGWPKERWVDIRSENVRRIMGGRIELAALKGFDAVDPDNVDGYDNKNGLGLTKADSIDFIHFLAAKAHSLNLSIGLKNAGDIIPSVLPVVDFSVNEQCVQYKEADQFLPFIRAGKPVLHIEYPEELKAKVMRDICARTGHAREAVGFSTVFKGMDLDGVVEFLDGRKACTPTVS